MTTQSTQTECQKLNNSQLLENYHDCLNHADDFRVHAKRFELDGDPNKAEACLELAAYWDEKALEIEEEINREVVR